jgi:hypothetical protein
LGDHGPIGEGPNESGMKRDCGVLVEVVAEDIGALIMDGKKPLHPGVAI